MKRGTGSRSGSQSESAAARAEAIPAKVLTVQEVSEYLRVHPSTIYRLLKRNQLPAFRIGSDWRFNLEAIDRWRSNLEEGGKSGSGKPN